MTSQGRCFFILLCHNEVILFFKKSSIHCAMIIKKTWSLGRSSKSFNAESISRGGAAGTLAFSFTRRHESAVLFKMNLFERNKSKNKGLISADRRTKPTLMLTIPHSYKVVYNGFISSNVWNCDRIRCWGLRPTRMRVTSEKVNNIAFQHGFWLRGVQS